MKRKILTLILVSLVTVSLVACGKDETVKEPVNKVETELEQGTINVDTENENTETEIPEDTEENIEGSIEDNTEEVVEDKEDEDTKERHIETMENNISNDIALDVISVNGKEYKFPVSKDDIEIITECSYSSSYQDTSKFLFVGSGWGIQSDPDDIFSFEGGTVFFMYDENEENIIAASTSEFWTKDDLKVSFAGISVGDSQEKVEELLGKPEEYKGDYYYKNNNGILVIEYDFDDLVDDISIFKNN